MDPRDRTFAEVHGTRRSVREYTGEVVSRDLVREIVAEATRAPSAFNSQPWQVVVVRGDALERVADALGGNAGKVRAAGTLVAVFADLGVLDEIGRREYYDGSTARTPEEYGARNGGILAMALMDVAWSHGVATRPMIGFDADALSAALDVPDGWRPVVVMSLGWPTAEPSPDHDRRPLDEVLTIIG